LDNDVSITLSYAEADGGRTFSNRADDFNELQSGCFATAGYILYITCAHVYI